MVRLHPVDRCFGPFVFRFQLCDLCSHAVKFLELIFVHLLLVTELDLCVSLFFLWILWLVLVMLESAPLRGCHLMLIVIIFEVETDITLSFIPVACCFGSLIVNVRTWRRLASLAGISLCLGLFVHLVKLLAHVRYLGYQTVLLRNAHV